jgi:tRNA dimethylallyltransferase
MARDNLYQRIEQRVEAMLAAGLLEEVRELQRRGYGLHLNALQTVGYKEAFLFLQNELSYEDLVRLMKQKSRNYAKRQLTWFRRDGRVRWVEWTENSTAAGIAQLILKIWSKI